MPITSFKATPSNIQKGQKSTLSWTSEGCENLVLLPLPGHPQGVPVDPNGTYDVQPDLSIVYMIMGSCSQPPSENTVLVMVEDE